MKTVILAGGQGQRFREERLLRPKPLVEVGNKPLIVHVMDSFGAEGFTEFVLALGYRASSLKHYFLHFSAWQGEVTVQTDSGMVSSAVPPPWTVHLVDTGIPTATGGRLRRLESWLREEDCFFLAYCDVLANLDLQALLAFHHSHGKLVTVAATPAPERFGLIHWNGDRVEGFHEKGGGEPRWVNCGFFAVERQALSLVEGDATSWEADVLPRLAAEGELMGFRHTGVFAPVDTPEDRDAAEQLCSNGAPPWRKEPAWAACS